MTENKNNTVPKHVSIIMDGNGRWAKKQGLPRWQGHVEGVESVRSVLKAAAKAGVEYLSIFAFSEENWSRSDEEVAALMALMMKSMLAEMEELNKEHVRFMVLGNRSRLTPELNATIDESMAKTAANDTITLIVFLSYSGKWDICQAVQKIASKAVGNPAYAQNLTMDEISANLVTSSIPDPDLIIRTSGETRISNYLLWQAAYSEFYFTDILWPDFKGEAFLDALAAYATRDRRYGKTD